ncbi:MAG: translocation/assembly module TamB domain-containing protein [Bacteroidales bacterium]|nr:translocation/assembly module TamB domain-containing protein [Candidatus Cacconaster scatequi]
MSRLRKIVLTLILALLLFPAAIAVCIQIPGIQTAVCNILAGRIADSMGGRASIGRIYFSPPNYLILKDVSLYQKEDGDTVACVGKLLVKVDASSLVTASPRIRRISIEKGAVHLEKLKPMLARLNEGKPPKDTSRAGIDIPFSSFRLDRLRVRDFSFSLFNPNRRKPADRKKHPVKLDWGDLQLSDINLEMESIVVDNSVKCTIKNISAKERYGFDMNTFGCDVVLDTTGIHIDGLHYNDGYSNLVSPHLDLLFNDFTAFKDFCRNVTFDATFDNTFLDFKSLRYYGLKDGINLKLYVDGRVTGPICHLDSECLDVHTGTRRTHLKLVPHIVGLPKSASTMASVKVLDLTTDSRDIAQVVSEVSKKKGFDKRKLSRLAPGDRIRFKGKLDGLFTDFVAYGKLEGRQLGVAQVDMICRADKQKGYTLDGYLQTYDFDLGYLLQKDALGPLTCTGEAVAHTGKNLDVQLNSLSIDSLALGKRVYNDIGVAGRYADGGLNVEIDCDDEWAEFDLAVNLSKLSLETSELDLDIRNLSFRQDSSSLFIGNVKLGASTNSSGSSATLTSSFADVGFDSDGDFASFVKSLSQKDYSNVRAQMSVVFKETEPLCKVFLPELYLSRNTAFAYEYSSNELGRSFLYSDLVAWGDTYVKDLTLRTTVDTSDILNVNVMADMIRSGGLDFKSPDIDVDILSDTAWSFRGRLNESGFHLGKERWNLKSDFVSIRKKLIQIDSLVLFNSDHSIVVDGTLGEGNKDIDGDGIEDSDKLAVRLNDIDMSLFESLFKNPVRLGGTFNGECSAVNYFGEAGGFLADLRADTLAINGRPFGDMEIRALWNSLNRRFDISLENTLDFKQPLTLTGSFFPENRSFDMDFLLDRLNPGLFEPFLADVVKNMGGAVSGGIKVHGPLDSLEISSESCRLDSAFCTLAYTNVPYIIDGPFSIDNKGVGLDGIVILDRQGNNGRVSGGVHFDNFKNLNLDTRISMENLLALNTTLSDNETFYGKAYASGTVHLGGAGKSMMLDIAARTEENTSIHIPVRTSGKDVASLLTFVSHGPRHASEFDSLVAARTVIKKKAAGAGMGVSLLVDATPSADVQLEINRSTGDILSASGDGQISITAGAGRKFNIKGDYVVQSGNYNFTLVGGMLSKDFKIEPGGTISMNGDIMDSRLDLIAKYRTKASLSTLVADTSSVGLRRNVECGIGLTGRLSNPELSFKVEIPDLDPATMSQVEAALNSEEKRMKQVLSLLISGSFVPEQQGGIVNSSTVLYSNVTEMMSNQFNKIFKQLDIPLDFGFNYQPTSDGRNIFDVAVSTQLFNNRVTINGNIGNRKNTTSNATDIIGDIDVQIKLNKAGKLLLNVFSHSTDQYSNYLDQAQRNGAGIVYKEDFDTFRELMRKMFRSKKRQQATQDNETR